MLYNITAKVYRCSNGHHATNPAKMPDLTNCPACIDGLPCQGNLTRIDTRAKKMARAS